MRIADADRAAHAPAVHPATADVAPPAVDDEEIARRREATLKRMLATPHMPHGAQGAPRGGTPRER